MDEAISAFSSKRIPPEEWEVIGPFVRSCISEMSYGDPRAARSGLVILARHVHWCWLSGQYPLERDILLRRDVIAESISKGMAGSTVRSRGTYRSRLFRISEALLEPSIRGPLVPTIGAAAPQAPYTHADVILLRAWAASQGTTHRRVNATLALALGLGAGLAVREMAMLTCADVEVDESEGVLLHVRGDRPRSVPVVAEWESPIAAVAQAAMRREQWLMLPGRRVPYARSFLSDFVSKTDDRPFEIRAQRMRGTWLVNHMASGVPVTALFLASGVESPEALWRYAAFVPGVDPKQARSALRRAGIDLGLQQGASR